MNTIGHECLAAGADNLLDDLFEYNEFWMLKVNGSGGSAVVIASRG